VTTRGDTPVRESSAARFAKLIASVVGVGFLMVGILGFVPGITTDYDTLSFAEHHSEAKLLGLFQVSILHNVVHMLFGGAALYAATRARLVPPVMFGSAVIYALLTIYGVLVDHPSAANFVPVNSADNWLHLVLAIGLAGLGELVRRRLVAEGTTVRR
jgi:hypothetical protein